MKFAGISVGDEVMVFDITGGSARKKVDKVGRKFFTVGRNKFRLDDGQTDSGYSWPSALPMAEHERNIRVANAKKALAAFGVRLDHFTPADKVLVVYDALRSQIEATHVQSTEPKP